MTRTLIYSRTPSQAPEPSTSGAVSKPAGERAEVSAAPAPEGTDPAYIERVTTEANEAMRTMGQESDRNSDYYVGFFSIGNG